MRTRTAIIAGAVAAALLPGGVAPAAAESRQAAAARAVPGRMLEAPRPEAFVRHLPVRVAVRVPARTGRLWVRVGRRNVTTRFHRTRGPLRVAQLRRSDGLRYGRNHLSVLAERRGRRPVIDSRSFVLARRHPELVRLRIRRGPVTSLNLRVAGEATLAQAHFGRRGEVARRLAVIRRTRMVRVWLNGRRVTRALDRSRPTRWTAKLSATHGLRHGVNRLRVLVAEPDRGRYTLLRRRFVVRRDRHLPAAGWDTARAVGGRVRLDGRRSRTIHGRPADHAWRILSKPRGSHAKLRRAGSARPLLTPDRRGRYVIGLRVNARTKRVSASQAPSSSTDMVTVTASPPALLQPFKALTYPRGPEGGIQVGSTFYPNPKPGAIQWLTLDRATLTPVKKGNSWLDATWDGDNGIKEFTDAVSPPNPGDPNDPNKLGTDQLVILSFAVPGSQAPAVPPDQLKAFNTALKAIGVGPIKQPLSAQALAVVGVPSGGDGSGWYTLGSNVQDLLQGWLMPDATTDASGASRFRFRPERVKFATSSSHTASTNAMTVGDGRLDASLPPGATGGFQLVLLDPIDLSVHDNEVYATNGVADPVSGLTAMTNLLTGVTGPPLHVAVQSIGRVAPPNEGDPAWGAWYALSQALAAYGANPHIFNTVDGSYAFLGGPTLERGEVLDSSSAFVTDPTKNPPTREPGTLSGQMSSGADGHIKPVATSPSDSFESPLYDIAFQKPTPWPYTKEAGLSDPEADAYERALADITAKLPDLKDKYPDLRQAYVSEDTLDYSHSSIFLSNLPYPGDGRTCQEGPAPPDPSKPVFTPYTREQFCNLSAELQLEFDWLDLIRGRFETYETVLTRTSGPEQANLQAIGTAIETAITPPKNSEYEIFVAVGDYLLEGFEALGLFFAPEVLLAAEFAADVFQLATTLASSSDGKPVGDQVKTKVDDLSSQIATNLFNSVNAMDSVRDVIISDYGRLKALGTLDGWSIKRPALATALTGSANSFFSSELMPVAYGVYALVGSDNPETCRDAAYGYTWSGAPASAQMEWRGGYDLDGVKQQRGRFVLGRHSLSIRYYAYPPASLTDKMFRVSTTSDGWNVYLPRYVWEHYDAPPGKEFPPTDLGHCH